MNIAKGKIFIVSAPSGAGKTTLVNEVLGNLQPRYPVERVITYTSKKPRVGEVDGVDYHFLSSDEFERRIEQGFFIEWSNAYGSYYGSPRHMLEGVQEGRSYILIIDRVGAQQVVQQTTDLVLIWIYTPSLHVLQSRLIARATESQADLVRRIARAQKEIEFEERQKLYKYHILNDKFFVAAQQLFLVFMRELQ